MMARNMTKSHHSFEQHLLSGQFFSTTTEDIETRLLTKEQGALTAVLIAFLLSTFVIPNCQGTERQHKLKWM